MGGIDWAGFEFVVQQVGVVDLDALVEDLLTIKTHKKPDDGDD